MPPATASPYFASCTTARTRRRLLEAALLDPGACVAFMTDGIVTTRELKGLERVKINGEPASLGDWERAEGTCMLMIKPGMYFVTKYVIDPKTGQIKLNDKGEKVVKHIGKTRGVDPKKFDRDTASWLWLKTNTLPLWLIPFDPWNWQDFPVLTKAYRQFITAGSAVGSEERWKLAGRWSPPVMIDGPVKMIDGEETVTKIENPRAAMRAIRLHDPGNKREFNSDPLTYVKAKGGSPGEKNLKEKYMDEFLKANPNVEKDWSEYITLADEDGIVIREAARCWRLIDTLHLLNPSRKLSEARPINWAIDGLEDQEEEDDIRAGFE